MIPPAPRAETSTREVFDAGFRADPGEGPRTCQAAERRCRRPVTRGADHPGPRARHRRSAAQHRPAGGRTSADGRRHHPPALQGAQEPGSRVAAGPGGRARAVDGDRVGGGRAGGRRPGRPVRSQHRVPAGQDRRAGPACRRSPGTRRGGRGAERRRPGGGCHGGGLNAWDHGRGRHRDGPVRHRHRGTDPGPGPAGDGASRAAL